MSVAGIASSSALGAALGTQAASNSFNKLDFYLVKNEVALFPKWNVYDSMYGSIKWQPNMGEKLHGLTPTPSPVQRSTFAPARLNAVAKKDIYKIGEREEEAHLSYHRYESGRFRFLSSFEDFWRDQLQYQHQDIVRQIQNANNQFVRTLMYYQTPDLYIAKGGSGYLSSSVDLDGDAAKVALTQTQIRNIAADNDSTAGTDAAIGEGGGQEYRDSLVTGGSGQEAGALTLKDLYKAMLVLQEDVQAPTFDRQFGVPKTSEMIKGKYILVCSTEAWASLLWDDDLKKSGGHELASTGRDFIKDGFAGDLFGKITVKNDPFPLRFTDTGAWVDPQSVVTTTEGKGKVIPNPNYTKIASSASNDIVSNEIAFLCGADAFKTISVGPPPKEFAGKNISKKKLYGMNWNGQVDLTDQFLVPTADITSTTAAASWDMNVYGDYLKFISQTIHGGIPGDARHSVPSVYRRRRTS